MLHEDSSGPRYERFEDEDDLETNMPLFTHTDEVDTRDTTT